MAKNKGGKKQKNVFHVANTRSIKAKNKAKPVLSTLKKINTATSEKVRKVNQAFTELHKDVAQIKKTPPAAAVSKDSQISRPAPEAPVDVDNATDLFSQL